MGPTIEVNKELIAWAISRAGYELRDIPELYPRARDWLDDKKEPTLPQLWDFAKKVHLPFGYLLLDEPPEEKLPIPFFRTLGGVADQVDLNVRDTILTLQRRQDWLREYLIEQGEGPLPWVGAFTTGTPVESITGEIRDVLNLDRDWASELPNWQKALDHLTERVEDAGIMITFNSVVGNNTHRSISVEDCRGFVLTDEYAPFLFVNSADSKSAQMFTIAHELAHLWIGESAGFDFRQLQPANNEIERYCDRVAAELCNGHIRKHFEKRDQQGDGGNFYATLRRRLNHRFIATVNRAVKENSLLYKDAYELTGLRGTTYENAINEFGL